MTNHLYLPANPQRGQGFSCPGLRQQQGGQHPAQTAIAVLKGVHLQEHHNPDADQQQRVKSRGGALVVEPREQLGHQVRRVEGRNQQIGQQALDFTVRQPAAIPEFIKMRAIIVAR
jgi:hypothetical protein